MSKPTFYLRSIKIKGFRAIDELELEFPEPLMSHDPDVFIMGSKNGLGKTSILEACALFILCRRISSPEYRKAYESLCHKVNLGEYLIRAGHQEAIIEGTYEMEGNLLYSEIVLQKDQIIPRKNKSLSNPNGGLVPKKVSIFQEPVDRYLLSMFGMTPEPLRLNNFMYFNSYRKVQEGSIELGIMIDDERHGVPTRKRDVPSSDFKVEILRALMERGELFEDVNRSDSETTLQVLNDLMTEFANGKIGKLRPLPDNTLEIRIKPLAGGEPFTFDGLSSGQKEIISTLFMIWRHTKDRPGTVLIDEPELHLNAEWHRKFIRHLHKLVPENQYIIATHSRDMFASVEPERRILIEKKKDDRHE